MGKHGPCYHCGVTSTPLWRNGPPEKPVLCNACGSRWRTKGSLTNYTPIHSRPDDFVDKKVSKVKIFSTNKNKEVKLLKRKQNHDNMDAGAGGIRFDHYSGGFKKVKDEQSSTRSSCGSVVSNSESCSQFHVADASNVTDPAESFVWDTLAPSKKRACVSHTNQSSVEKLTKDLHAILREQQSSYVSGSPENDLLVESEMHMASVEIHGSFLIKQLKPVAISEESEASSIIVENKLVLANDAYSREQEMIPTKLKSEKYDDVEDEDFQILTNCNSPLRNIDLNNVLNFEEFMRRLTKDEQQELVKFLPLADVTKYPDNLKKMFESKQFKESLYSFRHLLGEGVFDMSLVGIKNEDGEALKKFASFGFLKCQWVEPYNKLIKKCESSSEPSAFEQEPDVTDSSKFVNIKSSCDGQYRNVSEVAAKMECPKPANMKSSNENKEATTYSNSLLMPDAFHFTYESLDEDILLDVPYSSSFPQAELLH